MNKQLIKNTVVYFIILIFLCIVPIWNNAFQNSEKTISISSTTLQPLSVKDGVKQTLRSDGYIRTINIPISAPSGELYIDSVINIDIINNDKSINFRINAKDLGTQLSLDVTKYRLKGNQINLEISSPNMQDNTDVYLYKADDIGTGLDVALMGGVSIGAPIAITYTEILHNTIYFYSVFGFITLTLLLFLVAIKVNKNACKKIYFWYSFLIIFIIISLNNPVATFFTDPSSEVAYEFWQKAHNLSFFDNLMSLMSGECLVWPERILMYIADRIVPTKYVLIVAQIFQTAFISSSCSMLCLDDFEKYIPIKLRLLFSIVLGCYVLFPGAYYFWALSYWVIIFVLLFALLDLNKMSKYKYCLGVLVTGTLCVSRIYNIVFIPMAILGLLFCHERGKRFNIYMLSVILSSSFGVIYSLVFGGSGHLNTNATLDIVNVINNTIYYYVQVFNSIIFGKTTNNGLALNVFSFTAILLILIISIKLILKKEYKYYGVMIICLLGLGVGTVMINIVTCTLSTSVAFPYAYDEKVSWLLTYYQDADLHFSYAYFSLYFIFLTMSCALIKKCNLINKVYKNLLTVSSVILVIIYVTSIRNLEIPAKISHVPTDWKNLSGMLSDNEYYLAINTDYPFASISLTQNTYPVIIGLDENGTPYEWDNTKNEYNHTKKYNEINLNELNTFSKQRILTLTVRKSNTNFNDRIIVKMYDKNNSLLIEAIQKNTTEKYYADFQFDQFVTNVARLEFIYENGSPAYVIDALQFGCLYE